MGTADEQHPSHGGGTDPDGADIRLEPLPIQSDQLHLFPSLEQQLQSIETAEANTASAVFVSGGKKAPSSQMSLFSFSDTGDAVAPLGVSQQVIDEVLADGGNEQFSALRITAWMKMDLPIAENVAFLAREYGESNGKGFILDGRKISAWFTTDGIRIAEGDSVMEAGDATLLTWEQAATRTRELLDLGRYLPQKSLDQVDAKERDAIGEAIAYMERDCTVPFFLEQDVFRDGFPDVRARLSEMLRYPERITQIRDGLIDLMEQAQTNPDVFRFPQRNLDQTLTRVNGLANSRLQFSAEQEKREQPKRYITKDEIDQLLIRGSGVENGKNRIHAFFTQSHSTQEKVAFLKNEYGMGGFGRMGYNENHDAKGISFSRGNGATPYDKVLLSWPTVAKRITELIAMGRYVVAEQPTQIVEVLAEEPETVVMPETEPALDEPPEPDYEAEIAAIRAEHEALVGQLVTIDGRTFAIEEVRELSGDVSLRDVTFESAVGFPINRIEKLGTVYRYLEAETAAVFPQPDLEDDLHFARENLVPDETSFDWNGRTFLVDRVNEESGTVNLQDISFVQAVGSPMFRVEPISVVRRAIELEEQQEMQRTTVPASNFTITDDNLGHGGPKTKYGMNIAAIKTLKMLEAEQRNATPEEQEILSRYVGWGGVADAFDATKDSWRDEYTELQTLLTEEEYASARESVLNAHYTSPTVIRAMYNALENMGFTTGNVLEPACGVGNFFGLAPESMAASRFYGVELDSITGRIAKHLYPNHDIQIKGFENSNLPDSFFDVAIGNVPFGDYGIADKKYDKHHFMVHDYFLAKSLDQLRPGGVMAFITSSGTMDKKNPAARKYLAERAELLGAIRLPNNAFLANAGTGVVSDILFFQKRDRAIEIEPEWVHLGTDSNEFTLNQYFIDHPDMVLGELSMESTQYGKQACTVKPVEGAILAHQLQDAISNIHGQISEYALEDALEAEATLSIPADPNVKNFSFTMVDGEIYYRENSVMNKVDVSVTAGNRIRGMVEIRDCTRRLIAYQLTGYADDVIAREQQSLNTLYDDFTKKYGLLNSRGNDMAFSDDASYCLLCSLEVLDENHELERKADMFFKRTIRQQAEITHVDTASEALAVSLSERAKIDLPYMSSLTGKDERELIADLQSIIFLNPLTQQYETADEYLSGNVRQKLQLLKEIDNPIYAANIAALKQVQPKDLTASEIDVRLGAVWLPPDVIEQFTHDLFQSSTWIRGRIRVSYSPYTASWNLSNKNSDYSNITANVTYGTNRINGYRILEETLNLKDVRIFDTLRDADGKEIRVLNKKETILAGQKQQLIKEAFKDWIWQDPIRRERLTQVYNEKFNSTRSREYDGSHIRFVGMNPEIRLRKHQVDAVARVLYGGNSLMAHEVGAGKTFSAVAAVMESKRLGLCNKSLIVVPNHLTEQWSAEFLQLYPAANILVATKKDFEKRNRKKFCSRIATGEYDAVIIGHSQFEKIPMSVERQRALLQEQINEVMDGIGDAKKANAERFTIKQMERSKKTLKLKLDKLNDTARKDDVVTFEELGVDKLIVDEAHAYKNLAAFSKMRNVAGISQTEAQKSSDLLMKCRYMDELTSGRGIVFATGTPVSNSMTELFTMQRYLQHSALKEKGLQRFDAWASTFGETVTSIELAPEGTGFRARTRFARFYNLPELISMFKEVADIQTADMLQLPVPEAIYHNVALKPSEEQKEMVAGLAQRAERIRSGTIDPSVDNMLTVTNDGRKLALDQRLINGMLPDGVNSKVNTCVKEVYRIWEEGAAEKHTQLLFCDLSTPNSDARFSVYTDVKSKLLDQGVPESEIAFIHDANTETRKAELFSKVRSGQVRILLGSTAKMGAGTNVQRLLKAEHHLDIPWRPADLIQREGRAIRQGNTNPQVDIYRYVTEATFDAYMWATLENKQKFIGQIMTSKSPVRSCEDVDEATLSYAEVKALATGNPKIKERMDLEVDVSRLKLIKSNYLSQRYALEDSLLKHFPETITRAEERIAALQIDIATAATYKSDIFTGMEILGQSFAEKKDAGVALLQSCKECTSPESKPIGSYQGFELSLCFDPLNQTFILTAKGELSHKVELGDDVYGNIQRLDNMLSNLPTDLARTEQVLADTHQQMETAKLEVKKPFPQEQELADKSSRLATLDTELNLDQGRSESVATMDDQDIVDKTEELEADTDKEDKPSIAASMQAYREKEKQQPQRPESHSEMEDR